MLHVHLLFEHGSNHRPHGSAYIRQILPLSHPSLARDITVRFGHGYEPCDVLVINRTWTPWINLQRAEDTLLQARRDGCRVIYGIDDNIIDVNGFNLYERQFTEEQTVCVRLFAREADLVTTSTPALRARLLPLNSNIVVIPNSLDERLFPSTLTPARPPAETVTLGYMGTPSHERDLYLILEPLRAFLRQRKGKVRLELVGVAPRDSLASALAGLPYRILQPDCTVEYPMFVDWMRRTLRWDIGLAPLEDNVFARCKSDIKFLDYSLLGIPGIFSRVEAYRHTVQHLTTGFLADPTPGAWREGLTTLVDDGDNRETMRRNAFEYVQKYRVLEQTAHRWADALRQVMDNPVTSRVRRRE